MKRKIFAILLSIAVMSVTACGQESNPASTKVDDSVSEVLHSVTTPEPTPEPESLEGYTVKEICDFYLTGEKVDEELYLDQGQGWIMIPGSEWASYYPGAVYPDTDWEPEAVLQSYRDSTAPWVNVYSDCYALWDQEYLHRFEVNEDWFYIDMVRVQPLVTETHAVAPEDILTAYQAGEWDGEFWWSDDYSTRVRMNWYDGSLEYHYSTMTYTTDNDPLGLAYTGYGELPEYLSDERGELFKSSGSKGITSYSLSTRLDFYPDLPNGHLDGMKNIMRIDGVGVYVTLDNAIEQYYQGKKIQSWPAKITDDAFIAPRWEDNTLFVYTNGQILRLLDNGKTEIVLDNVVGVDYGMEGTCYALTLTGDNGLLSCHEVFSGNTVDIAIDIVAVDARVDFIVYEEASGGVYALYPRLSHCFYYDDATAYLGTESREFYVGEFDEFEGYYSEFIERYSSANAG